jgi:membrane associated rhomboid family serine protease
MARMLRELGGVFGIAIIVPVFAGTGSYSSVQAFSDGFVPAIAVAAALALAGAMTGLVMAGRRRPAEPGRAIRLTPTCRPVDIDGLGARRRGQELRNRRTQ